MITADQVLSGREALLAAAGHHPYARHALRPDRPARGWRHDGTVGWLLAPGEWSAGGAVGPPEPALDVFAALRADGTLRPGQSVNLSRVAPATVTACLPVADSRPGDAGIVDWYGIRDGDRLLACGADRSRGDVGFLAGLTVAPGQRGRGLGAALTAGMTHALFGRYDQVALGVYPDNVGAIRLYRRLGFTNVEHRTSIRLG
ncbi:GNAT family N-acetyltransferase [Micromonospora sp. NPDC050980]|uniref:GNAT family N-acetyltransferase n=1 Tax=Micromonospora sp. NPDC050980 TaxID=3155161 RepID=UPI003410CB2E